MKCIQLLFVAILVSISNAFVPSVGMSSMAGGSSFMASTKSSVPAIQHRRSSSSSKSQLYMGNQAKFGIFSPAVYVAKIALGKDKLNKIRGKAISLHSEYIGQFCEWVGAYHLRGRLIKKAKTNGDVLGFLV